VDWTGLCCRDEPEVHSEVEVEEAEGGEENFRLEKMNCSDLVKFKAVREQFQILGSGYESERIIRKSNINKQKNNNTKQHLPTFFEYRNKTDLKQCYNISI
jgi:hypothetical protein